MKYLGQYIQQFISRFRNDVYVDGNVGIGTTSPSNPLTVVGADSVGIDDYILHNDDGNTKFGFPSNDTFKVRTAGSDRLYINSSGNVGIGTTSPSEKLHVSGNAIITGDLTVSGTTTTINTANLNVEDKNITLNFSASDSSSSADGAGITIQDAVDASNDATILWTAASDTFTFSHPINSTLATAAQPNITSLGTLTALQVDNINLDGSTITNSSGDLTIVNTANDADVIFQTDDGSGGTTEYFRVDGGSEKTIYTKPISLLDSVGLQLGTGTDAQIYHTGSEGTFINYTGNFRFIQSADNADLSFFSDDGSGGTTEYFKVDGSDERTLFSKKVKIDHDVSDASVATNALDIDVDIEGSDTISGDVTQKGLNIDVRSTATGGDTSDEHRLMGVYSRARTAGSGDADSVTGVYGLAESGRSSSATTSLMRGVQGIAYANDSAAATNTDIRGGDFSCYVNTDGPDVTSMYGVISNAYTNTNSTDNVSNVSGLYGKAESRGSGTISTANGVYGEIEVDAGTITTGNCFRAVLDHNGGTLTTGYMFRGSAAGTIGTTIGVYIDGEDKNYFSNRVGIGTTSPSHLLHVNAADGVAVDTAVVKIRNQEATAGDNFGLYVQAGSNSSDISFRVADKDDNEYLRVRGDGNVGIGTTNPTRLLQVEGDVAYSTGGWAVGTTATQVGKLFNDSGLMRLRAESSREIALGNVSGGEAMRIDAAGNVGIGTTSPASKLHVDGDVQVGVDDTGYDVKFFGATSGASFLYDQSGDQVTITGPTTAAQLELFTISSGIPTVPQIKIGRDSSQYYGALVNDRQARVMHRQDETSGTMHTYFEQWDSNTSDDTGTWQWRAGDGDGNSMATVMTLTQAGDITTTGNIELGHASDTTIARSAAGKVTIEGAPVQTTQMVVTTHNFQLTNNTTIKNYVPFNNLNESTSGGPMNNYWTRTLAPYPGTIKKIAVRSQTSLGSSCELRISKITDTTDKLEDGTHVDNTSIDLSTAQTTVITTMNTNSFAAGDAVGVALQRSAGTAAQVIVTIVWEYTV